jgi:cysteinyl-tRNA synthetase
MGLELLGERMDIHSGGVDLIFPHHENEIAQSEGCLGHRWVNHWVHGEFLMVEGQKMAKSLGNFFTLRDLVAKGVDPIALRYAIQSNHYRKVLNFSFEGLRAAENALKRIRAFRARMEGKGQAGGGPWKASLEPSLRLEQAREAFWAAMADDLNTPEALAAVFTLISDLNAQDDHMALTRVERDAVLAFLNETDSIFAAWPRVVRGESSGVIQIRGSATGHFMTVHEVETLIEARRAAKAAKNWAEADHVRDQLKTMGIVLEDRKDGSTGWRNA